ncbi:leucine-rich repeat protein [Bacteroides sp. 519]|uniref:leucine-rich repeat protein n=1 Tax=Bacteroides sp. 519 TaxID=2302937 RepID=UPI0013D6B7AA|nr:leucine-rich repeat protein [Bacteroides sp. 519]NDV58060.1 hypothetical protein [Bacteroides sp. 519]
MDNLDIKDIALQQQVSNDDRILMTQASNDHSASAMTVGAFKELAIDNAVLRKDQDDETAHHLTVGGLLVKSPITHSQSRSHLSSGIEEQGNQEALSASIVEETNNPDILSKALVEETTSAGFEGSTLGCLDNVDESFDALPNGKYAFEKKNGILYPVASGNFVAPNVMNLTFISPGIMTIAGGNPAVLEFNFSSTVSGEPTGNGNMAIKVGSKTIHASSISQGKNSFEVSNFLGAGDNTVTVEVTDSYATTRKLTYGINVVNLSLSSTFDPVAAITGKTFSYRYTPVGSIEKTVYFLIDGEVAGSYVTSVSNRQLNYTLPNMGHGSHTLEVYMTAAINGASVMSNSLFYDLICVEDGKTTPVIVSPFRQTTAEQFGTVIIPYVVYNPAQAETDISLVVDNTVVSSLKVGRTEQTWNYRIDKSGNSKFEIVCGATRKTFLLQVEQSSIEVTAETESLELFLSSMGRNNSETNRDRWEFKGKNDTIAAQLVDFNWGTNGWIPDSNGNVALKLTGDARVVIPVHPSQYYPRKNYKTNFKKGFTLGSGEKVSKYKLTADVIAASVFCEKADFAESSGTHNTGVANLADEVLKDLGLLTPPQLDNKKVRTTVCGFPIVIFHKKTADSEPEFVGKYNFNTDKAAEETFGFTSAYPNCQCWEFRNNTSGRMLFKESDYTRKDQNGKPDWLNDFEARYPDNDDLNATYESGTIPENLKRVTDWVVSCIGNVNKFRTECPQYFNVDNLVFYFMFTELLGMVDQRAKNMFITTWDGQIWYFILYDNDTCLGINNEGEIVFNYNIETHDVLGSQNVWNGAGSELWKLVEQAYPDEIAAMYNKARQQDILTYERVYTYLNINQSEKWCESIYNEDGKFKYIDPLTKGYYDYGQGGHIYTGEFLYALQGSRADHRKWWLYNRFRYMDSKYNAGNYFGDTATLRLYTPAQWTGVKPNADFALTPYADQYLRVKFGSYLSPEKRGNKDKTSIVYAPTGTVFNDTETIIYGASRLKSVGDLSAKYPGTVDMSSATKLEELIIGNSTKGYKNTNLRNVTVKSNRLLRKINVENCPAYTAALDLSGCESIQEVYAKGSGCTAVVLPSGGMLERIELPQGITNLTLRNQANLTDAGLVLESVENISTLWIENIPGVDSIALVEKCMASDYPTLERVRLVGIDTSGESLNTLIVLMNLAGLDEKGNNSTQAVVTGKYHAVKAYADTLPFIREAFPDLEITYDMLADTPMRTIIVQDYNTKAILRGADVVINGIAYVSDENGKVTIKGREAINVSISLDGYKSINQNLSEILSDTTNYIWMDATVEVTFIVKSKDKFLISKATIVCDGKSVVTDIQGRTVVGLSRGTYEYTCTFKNSTYNGRMAVGTIAKEENVVLEIPLEDLQPEYNGNIQIGFKSNGLSITISSSGANYIIHWGDGQTTAATGTGSRTYYHVYFTDDIYNFEISDCDYITSIYINAIAYWSVGTSRISNLSFNSKSALIAVGSDIFKNDSKRSSFYECFAECTNLRYIPAGLFDHCSNVTNIRYCFRNCTLLTSIPIGLFDFCPNVTDFTCCFQHCTSITSIPTGLFDFCPNVTSFFGCFYGSTSITSIPAGLFDYCPDVTDFYGCFYSCISLVSIPAGLFDNCIEVTNFNNCFNGCTKLTFVVLPKTIKNLGNSTYAGCTSLIYIEAETTTPSTIYSTSFSDTNNCPIYVPDSALNAYKTATNWDALAKRILPISQKN